VGLEPWFRSTENSVTCTLTGSEFIFRRLRGDMQGIRPLEGVTRCWLEEAPWCTADSWLILDPSIRKQQGRPDPQICVSYNPFEADDPMHLMFADRIRRPFSKRSLVRHL
jgi:phage terminase large subunit